jgi:hypothetical protein
VLDWNPAVDFYKRIGAISMDDWTVNRLTGQALERLAAGRFDDTGIRKPYDAPRGDR